MYDIIYDLLFNLVGYLEATTFPELFFQVMVSFMSVAVVLYMLDLVFYTLRYISRGL